MKKRNKYILGGFISGLTLSLLASLHLYTYSNRMINRIKDNNCWNDEGY